MSVERGNGKPLMSRVFRMNIYELDKSNARILSLDFELNRASMVYDVRYKMFCRIGTFTIRRIVTFVVTQNFRFRGRRRAKKTARLISLMSNR